LDELLLHLPLERAVVLGVVAAVEKNTPTLLHGIHP